MEARADRKEPQGAFGSFLLWLIATTVFVEGITLWLRFGRDFKVESFNETAPFLLQIHHMFWSIPFFLVAIPLRRFPRVTASVLGCGLGLVASDLLHHFVILPATIGQTGWHWP